MRGSLLSIIVIVSLQPASVGLAQFGAIGGGNEVEVLGQRQTLTQRWQVGVKINAVGGPCAGLFGTVPVPQDWPEQNVKIVDEEISPFVRRVTYRDLGGVRQMLFTIPFLPPGETATALVTFEVTRTVTPEPQNPDRFVFTENAPRDVRQYLGASPGIECRNGSIRSLSRELTSQEQPAWRTVESIYDWVRENVKYENGSFRGAAAALQAKSGSRDDLTSLFVALCRAAKIPARLVFVPDNSYAEFYLEDENGEGHWLPCQVAGTRDFGSLTDSRPILQKGDNFKVPEKRTPQRFVAEFLTGKGGTGRPDVQFVRNLLPAD